MAPRGAPGYARAVVALNSSLTSRPGVRAWRGVSTSILVLFKRRWPKPRSRSAEATRYVYKRCSHRPKTGVFGRMRSTRWRVSIARVGCRPFDSWALLLILRTVVRRPGCCIPEWDGRRRAITVTAMLIVLIATLRIFFATPNCGRASLDVRGCHRSASVPAVDGFNIYLLLVAPCCFRCLAAGWTTRRSPAAVSRCC